MKIMIEVSGGVVTNIVSTEECSIYLIDHDNIKERCDGEADDCITDAKQAMQPYRVTYEGGHVATPGGSETPEFDECLNEALSEYEQGDEAHDREEAGTPGTYNA
jgi:hypothetical protein